MRGRWIWTIVKNRVTDNQESPKWFVGEGLQPLPYKRFKSRLVLWLLVILLSACNPLSDAPVATDAPRVSNVQFITPSVNVTTEENRFVITLWAGDNYFTDVSELEITAHDPTQAGHPATWTGFAENYNDYAIPYWVVYPDFTAAGIWRLDATLTTTDGKTINGSLLANVSDAAPSIVAGEVAPLSETITLADGLPLLKMTTDPTPLEALYDMSIVEAINSDKPSIITFASPGLCSNFICAPVVDSTVEALHAEYGDRFNVLHVEIYNLETSEYIPAMEEWGLNYEPWTYVVDTDGIVLTRFDGPISISELQPWLAEG